MIILSYSTDIMQQIQSRKMNSLNTYKVDTERKQIQHYVNPGTYNNATFIVVKKSPWNTVDKWRSALILEKNMCKIHFAMFNQIKVCIYIGEGNGNSLQYSCLENSIDRGAWTRLYSPQSHKKCHKKSDTTEPVSIPHAYI